MSRHLILDSHLDLGFSALQINRDLTQPATTIRTHDPLDVLDNFGSCTVSLPELRRGGVGIVCATVMSRLDPGDRATRTGMYTQAQTHGVGRGHLAYYQALERLGHVEMIHTSQQLDDVETRWREALNRDECPGNPIGIILSMESADPILGPDQVPEWHALGLRMVSLSHYGTSTYSHGTATEGGLLPPARPLLRALAEAGIIVDVTHLTDAAHWELLDCYDGPICASHHNCRTLTPGQRQLTDDMIRSIAERDGVIGTAFDAWMLDPDWRRDLRSGDQQTAATLQTVVDHIDHTAQLMGSSRFCGIGTDLDGGFGTEQSPRDLNTIADLPQLVCLLSDRGYSDQDIDGILCANWLRLLKKTWQDPV
ncbi:MAG: peptidase M19 [Gemmatimonadetes bacterium]|nr:peptidase M19 [Gemmatimonadota bacterium]MBT6145167.1 peptidase M19 [Gemmatimonadota bacterium]MBT7859746.1 peptidase M19 [Gemmatimonadota bacterium]